jgi:radical SAM superfamily enzyme YgiQ (UPF0313 family)
VDEDVGAHGEVDVLGIRKSSPVRADTLNPVRVLLVNTYELGHQPVGIAAPAATIRARGHNVRALDLSVDSWDADAVAWADRVAFSVPMHTAMRIARDAIARTRTERPDVPIAAYGLYAPMLEDVADRVIAGETDAALAAWVDGDDDDRVLFLGRSARDSAASPPARDLLPALDRYAHLVDAGREVPVAYVEASHGCAHRCRHCPVPVIYDGRIRILDADAVVADVAQQVEAGARHLTFGDPDFLNGVHHSLRVARAVHDAFPDLSFDCTVKVEHILRHANVWPELAELGCRFVISAFESTNDAILERFAKGHTVADEAAAVALLRAHGIEIRPTWVPFTPWTTLDDVHELLRFVAEHDLVANVDPVQYTIRLLIPRDSLLLDLREVKSRVGAYDADRGAYPWTADDPELDVLQLELAALVESRLADDASLVEIYRDVCVAAGLTPPTIPDTVRDVPRLTEPWFCCAEPTALQLGTLDPV